MSIATISGERQFVTQPFSTSPLPEDSGIALPMILKHLEPFTCFPLLRVCQSWRRTLLNDLNHSLEIPVLRSIADHYHIKQLNHEKKSLRGEEKEKIDERIRNASFWIKGAEEFFPVPLATLMERKQCDFLVQEICDAYVQIALKKDPDNIGGIVSAMSAQYEAHDLLSSLKMTGRVLHAVKDLRKKYGQSCVIAELRLESRERTIIKQFLPRATRRSKETLLHRLGKICKALVPEDKRFLLSKIRKVLFSCCLPNDREQFLAFRQFIMQQIKDPSCAHMTHPLTLIANKLLFEILECYLRINERKKAFELLDTLQDTVAEQKDRIGLLFRLVAAPLRLYVSAPNFYDEQRELVVQLLDRGLKGCHELRLTSSDIAESDLWPWVIETRTKKILCPHTIENYFSIHLKNYMESICLHYVYDRGHAQAISNFAEFIQNKWESWKRDNQYNGI